MNPSSLLLSRSAIISAKQVHGVVGSLVYYGFGMLLVCHDYYFVMREMQENYYLVLFMFDSKLYFYVLRSISLLGYLYFNLVARVFL